MTSISSCPPSRGTRVLPSLATFGALGLAVLATTSGARAQGSDDCSTAQDIGNAFGTFPVSTLTATGSNAGSCATMQNDVWFLWTAPVSGTTIVSLCSGGVTTDTVLQVWATGACPPTTQVACSDDSCGSVSQASFTAVSGTQYLIGMGNYPSFGAPFSGTFDISGPPVPPANDECAAATAISGTGLFPFSNAAATTSAQGQTNANCNFFSQLGIAHDVWYTWTAPSSHGIATIETCSQTSVDTKIAVYAGAGCPVVAPVACNDDTCSLQSRVQFGFTPGAVYTIQLGTYVTSSGGTGNMNITVGAPQVKISQVYGAGGNAAAPILNDYIELYNAGPVAQDISGWSVQYMSSSGTPTVANTTAIPAATVLGPGRYLLVQEAAGAAGAGSVPSLPAPQATGTIAMSATDFKVALVNTATILTTGVPTYTANPTLMDFVGVGVANWNDAAAAGGTFAAAGNAPAPGTCVSVYRNNCGANDTNVSNADWSVGFPAPRNTSTAQSLGLSVIGTALPMTQEPTFPIVFTASPFRCATSDVLAGTTVTVDLSALGGSATAALVDNGTSGDEIANDGLFTLATTIPAGAVAGNYALPISAVNGGQSGASYVNIVVTPASAPDNDNCFGAQPIAIPSTTLGNLTGATAESNPTASGVSPSGMSSSRGLWYSLTGNGNQLTASLCATVPSVDSRLIVLAGTCDGLTVVTSGDDNGPSCTGTQASATWCSIAGQQYLVWIAPFAVSASTGTLTLNITDGAPCGTGLPIAICTGTAGPFTEVEPAYGPATNDGCATSPNRFTDIPTPGVTPSILRGTARGISGNRDVDAYRFQATTSGPITITIDTLGAQAQAQLASLSAGGVCPSTAIGNTPILLTRCATGVQTLNSTVTAGTWYQILVVGGVGLQGAPTAGTVFGGMMPGGTTYQYTLSVSIGGPPANDLCASAATLTIGTATAGSTQNATNDGTSTCDPTGRDVWYQFTLATASDVLIDTAGSAIDTVLSLYATCGGTEIACNDDGVACFVTAPASSIGVINLAAGTYRIRVSDKNIGSGGAFNVRVRTSGFNDNCCGAVAVGIPSATAGTTVGATLDAPTPPVCDGPGVADRGGNTAVTAPSVWYTVTSPVNQTIYADVLNASHDSKLTVYTGSCGALTCVTMNDDINAAFKSKVAWQATAGQTYLVMVHGFGTGTGTFTLNVTADPTPVNDLCGNATLVTGATGSIAGTLVGATGDNSTITSPTLATCATANTYWDVWYTWTATCDGSVTFGTCGTFDTIVSVHTACPTTTAGNMLAGACNDNGASLGCSPGSEASFTAVAGTTYLVRVATAGALAPNAGGGSPFTLTWSQTLVDTDGDLTPDCFDGCPTNPALTAPATFYADVDGDTFGAGAGILSCGGAGLVTNNTDCDDNNAAVNPNATEVCNGIDDDCDTFTDEGVQSTFYADADGDLYGNPSASVLACTAPSGYVSDNTDCNDGNAAVNPGATEVCNGVDDDCDTGIDEGVLLTFYADADGDTYGNAGSTTQACSAPSGYVSNALDCNDGNAGINPAATEVCDGQDNNCNASTDEGFDADGDGVADCFDNCPTIANATQDDADADTVGDACDNCPSVANPSQANCDGDLIGDACEGEPDCNLNQIPDSCDIAGGGSQDLNANSVPDECEGIVAFCFGDGAANGGPACPCGNNVAIGVQRGCVNSTGNGALLAGTGPTSLSGDGLTLTASSMPGVTSALFIQGTASAGSGLGTVPFNDGLQCLDGSLVRLGTRIASGGTSALGFPGTPISLLGGVGAPGQRFYQVVYRNNAGPCNFLSNSTNGLRVIWTP